MTLLSPYRLPIADTTLIECISVFKHFSPFWILTKSFLHVFQNEYFRRPVAT
jgi:hypothetical protein